MVLLHPGVGVWLSCDPADHPTVVTQKDQAAPLGKEPFNTEVLGSLDPTGPQRGHRPLAIWALWWARGFITGSSSQLWDKACDHRANLTPRRDENSHPWSSVCGGHLPWESESTEKLS